MYILDRGGRASIPAIVMLHSNLLEWIEQPLTAQRLHISLREVSPLLTVAFKVYRNCLGGARRLNIAKLFTGEMQLDKHKDTEQCCIAETG